MGFRVLGLGFRGCFEGLEFEVYWLCGLILLMIESLHDLIKVPKLWELWYIPHYGLFRVYIINHGEQKSGVFVGGVRRCSAISSRGVLRRLQHPFAKGHDGSLNPESLYP